MSWALCTFPRYRSDSDFQGTHLATHCMQYLNIYHNYIFTFYCMSLLGRSTRHALQYLNVYCCGVSNDGIHSLVSRRGRDVHCIVGVLGSATTRYDSVITRRREEPVAHTLLTEPQGLWPACYVRLITRVSRRNA